MVQILKTAKASVFRPLLLKGSLVILLFALAPHCPDGGLLRPGNLPARAWLPSPCRKSIDCRTSCGGDRTDRGRLDGVGKRPSIGVTVSPLLALRFD